MTDNQRLHDKYCATCDLAEFSGITYEAAHAASTSPNRCRCGVPVNVSHYCSALDHAFVGARPLAPGCLYHREDPYPAGCPDCADAVEEGRAHPAIVKPEDARLSTGSATEEVTRLRSLLQTTEAARDTAPAHDYAGDPKHCHQCALRAFANAELRTRHAESRLSSLTQAHARLRTAAQGVLDRNGGPTDTPYGPFVFVARSDFDAMEAALKAADLACTGQSAEDGATVQLARLTKEHARLIAEWTAKAIDAAETANEAETKASFVTAGGQLERASTLRECIADLAAVAETERTK